MSNITSMSDFVLIHNSNFIYVLAVLGYVLEMLS